VPGDEDRLLARLLDVKACAILELGGADFPHDGLFRIISIIEILAIFSKNGNGEGRRGRVSGR